MEDFLETLKPMQRWELRGKKSMPVGMTTRYYECPRCRQPTKETLMLPSPRGPQCKKCYYKDKALKKD